MYIAEYYPLDVMNGPGTRCTLFVSGCEHRCKGCYNSKTWFPEFGSPYSEELEQRILSDLSDTRIRRQGLSLSGGDPLFPPNLATILKLIKRVKHEMPDKDIWCWTGYKIEELTLDQKQLLPFIDVLIDGQFLITDKDSTLVWRGSRNQRVIEQPSAFIG